MNDSKQIVFIAGGIGITPFRSMIQFMIDKNISLAVTLFYIGKTADDFLFRELFEKAVKTVGLSTVYIVTQKGERLDEHILQSHIIDITHQMFYISGPQPMVERHRDMLQKMHVPLTHIKTDLFTGYEDVYAKSD